MGPADVPPGLLRELYQISVTVSTPMANVTAYIDGLNLYHGMMESDLGRFRWLDLMTLATRMCKQLRHRTGDPGWVLGSVCYFTSRVDDLEGNAAGQRQSAYLRAHKSTYAPDQFQYRLGKYKQITLPCNTCNSPFAIKREKQTDVKIAVAMIEDAAENDCERLLLVTGDSDLVPAVSHVRYEAQKLIAVVAPPNRHSADLSNEANHYMHFNRTYFSGGLLLQNPVIGNDGLPMYAPTGWVPAGHQ